MSTLSKSPVYVAREALAIGSKALRRYAHKFSPKRYTQPQLFACLVLKTFFKTDYRGVCAYLRDLTDLRSVLGLHRVAHFTTLQQASVRLLRFRRVRQLLHTTLRRRLPRRRRIRRAAFDSTGLDCGHRSHYYVRRRSATNPRWQRMVYRHYAKLELAMDTASHVILAALPAQGPRVDTDRLVPLLDAALEAVRIEAALADATACVRSSRPRSAGPRRNCRAGVIGGRGSNGWTSTRNALPDAHSSLQTVKALTASHPTRIPPPGHVRAPRPPRRERP